LSFSLEYSEVPNVDFTEFKNIVHAYCSRFIFHIMVFKRFDTVLLYCYCYVSVM
jgi:hypothetical protein